MPSSPRDWSPTICDHTAPPSVFLGSNAGMSAGDGRTSERRIRISQRGGGSADATAQEPRLRAEILVHPRGCLQHQRPTSSHFSLNAPRASRCGDGHLADHRRSSLKIPEPPTLRTRPHGNVTIPSQGGNRARYDDGVLAIHSAAPIRVSIGRVLHALFREHDGAENEASAPEHHAQAVFTSSTFMFCALRCFER